MNKDNENNGCRIELLNCILIVLGIIALFSNKGHKVLLFLILIGVVASLGGSNNEKK